MNNEHYPSAPPKKTKGCFTKVLIALGILFALFILIGIFGSDSTDKASEKESLKQNNVVEDSKETTSETPASTPLETAAVVPEVEEIEPFEHYESGMYKVGVDIPSGSYYLDSESTYGSYYAINKDSSGEFKSIICNKNFLNHSFVELNDDEYFELKNATAYPIADAPEFLPDKDGFLSEGQYRIGVDIPAGEYSLVSTSDFGGYWARQKSVNDDLDSIIANDNFQNSTYVSVKDGEYLNLSSCKLKLQ